MNQEIRVERTLSGETDQRGISQAIVVAVILAIITGGVWSLYMTDAPYHPEVTRSENGITQSFD